MTEIPGPLAADPSIAAACASVQAGVLGQRLAVYAAARSREPLDDALVVLGLPLVHELLTTLEDEPVSVTVAPTAPADAFEHWSLILTLRSGLRVSIDLGSGLGPGQAAELDLRIEWTGAERVLLVEPARAAVTVANSRGAYALSAEVAPIAAALLAFAPRSRELLADPPATWQPAAAVIAAARESAADHRQVNIAHPCED